MGVCRQRMWDRQRAGYMGYGCGEIGDVERFGRLRVLAAADGKDEDNCYAVPVAGDRRNRERLVYRVLVAEDRGTREKERCVYLVLVRGDGGQRKLQMV